MKQSRKICLRLLLSQKHDANRQRGFHINHVLLEQALCEIAPNEGVVLRLTQKRGHPFEGFEKTGEIVKGVPLEDFLLGCLDAVTSHERAHRGWLDGAFQVQMKLSFREGVDLRREAWWFHPQNQCGSAGPPALAHAVSQKEPMSVAASDSWRIKMAPASL